MPRTLPRREMQVRSLQKVPKQEVEVELGDKNPASDPRCTSFSSSHMTCAMALGLVNSIPTHFYNVQGG